MDAQVQARIDAGDAAAARLRPLLGAIAIANARLAYQDYPDIFATPRWQQLAQPSRARPPRLLWASTGTKYPPSRDTLYFAELIGADALNTVTPATLDALRDPCATRETGQPSSRGRRWEVVW